MRTASEASPEPSGLPRDWNDQSSWESWIQFFGRQRAVKPSEEIWPDEELEAK